MSNNITKDRWDNFR